MSGTRVVQVLECACGADCVASSLDELDEVCPMYDTWTLAPGEYVLLERTETRHWLGVDWQRAAAEIKRITIGARQAKHPITDEIAGHWAGRIIGKAVLNQSDSHAGSEQWDYATASWCKARGHDPRVEIISRCRTNAGPKSGHFDCEPILTAVGIGAFLGVADTGEQM